MEQDFNELLEVLPEKIGKYIRRFAAIGDDTNLMFHIQYTDSGIFGLFAGNSSDVLIAEQGNDLPKLVSLAQANLDALNAIEQRSLNFPTVVYIDPEVVDQGITNIGVIRPFGTITAQAPCVYLPKSFFHVFFQVRTNDYLLTFGRREITIFFEGITQL